MRKIIKKILWEIRGGYKPKEFWEKWANTFMDDPWQVMVHPQHKWMAEKVRDVNPKNILEVGCGFGRNIKFLIEKGISPEKMTGVDISPRMLSKAEEYIGNKDVKLIEADVRSLPFKNKEFDLTLVHGVFMHVKPENIRDVVRESFRVSKSLIIVEQNYNGNEFTFVHDYKNLYKKFGGKIKEYIHNKNDGLDYFYVKVR